MDFRIFHSSPIAITLFNLSDGRCVDVNPAAEQLLGAPRDELLGQHYTDWETSLAPGVSNQLRDLFAEQGRIDGFTCSITTRRGMVRACLLSIEALEHDGVPYALTHIVDVTARKAAEDARRVSEAQLAAVIACTPDIIFTVDRQLRIQFINRVPAGMMIADALWTSALDYVLPEHRSRVERSIHQVFTTGQPAAYEIQARGDHGKLCWYATRLVLLTTPGTPDQVLLISQDITERKRDEERLQRVMARLQILADASAAFAAAGMDEATVLDQLVRRTADSLGASCVVRLLSDDRLWLDAAAVYDPSPTIQEAVSAIFGLTRLPIDDPHPVVQVVRSGQPLLIPELDPESLRTILAPDLRPALDLARLHSGLITPLRAYGQILGGLVFVRHRPDQPAFTEDDLTLAQDLADRAGLALANARLYRAMQAAQQAAQESHARLDALISSLPTGVGYLDPELRYQLVNPVLAAMNGPTPAEHLGRTLAEMVPGLTPQLEPLMRQVLATGNVVKNIELRGKAAPYDDIARTWLVSYFPVPGSTKAIAGVGVTVTDITASRRTEQQLHQSEARFATIFERSPIALGIGRLSDGRITDVNTAFEVLYGYSRAQIIGRTTLELGLWANVADRQRVLAQLHTQQRVTNVESVARTVTGAERPVLISGEVVSINDEPHVLMQIMDISALKAAQQELQELNRTLEERVQQRTARVRESEARFRALVTATSNSMYRMSPDWSAMLQLEGRDFIATTTDPSSSWLDTYIYPEDQPHVLEVIQTAIRTGTMFELEHRVRRVDGGVGWTLSRAVPLVDASGTITEWFGAASDVTARKQAEDALRESETQNRLLFEESPEAMILFDQTGRIVRANHACAQLVGYPITDLLGQTLDALGLLTRAELEQIVTEVRPVLQHGAGVAEVTLTLHCPDGAARVVDIRAFALSFHTQRHYLVGLHDITAKRQTEAALRQANAELARAARAKDEFLANMSHEIRTPLNAILAFSESLQDGIYGPISPPQHVTLNRIVVGGQHLLSLLNDILDLAKVGAGRLELQAEWVGLTDLCQASLLFVREQALKKALVIDCQLNNPLAVIEGDPKRLKQMLVNLLSNAVKFTPAQGMVRLEVIVDEERGVVRFAVQDTGIGIAPEDLGQLFRPFSQLDSALNRQYEGTGLGLALVHRLAALHGGSVTVESTLGVGSCFTITLPYRRAPLDRGAGQTPLARPDNTLPSSENDGANTRILLAEDNEATIDAIGTYLRASGYEVIVAHDGHEALTRAEEGQPDIILMDIQMPGLDGLETMRRLRVLPAYRSTPIIALTALAMPGDQERCLAAGANAYLTKPVSLRKLAEVIRQLVMYEG